ncbi:hypothetical protein [uncultured Leptotrichia sp.]|uniref:hypothetical protein n=1 Tax=uncultured Leptotrichia sp. TaxID=159271 RepID=UPI0025FA945F|nr:hypothetical protein [uncultured Leptotrichia sp.]
MDLVNKIKYDLESAKNLNQIGVYNALVNVSNGTIENYIITSGISYDILMNVLFQLDYTYTIEDVLDNTLNGDIEYVLRVYTNTINDLKLNYNFHIGSLKIIIYDK